MRHVASNGRAGRAGRAGLAGFAGHPGLAALLAVCALGEPATAHGQVAEAFSWLRFSAGAGWITPNLPRGDFWTTGAGLSARVETPLRPGVLSFGVQRHTARAGADVTDPRADPMRWSLLYAGWGPEVVVGPASFGAEGRIGALLNTAPEGVSNRTERELFLGAALWAAQDIASGWGVRGEVGVHRVYSSTSWTPVSAVIGARRSLGLGARIPAVLAAPPPPPTYEGLARMRLGEVSPWASFPDAPYLALADRGVSTDRVDRSASPGFLRAPEGAPARIWLDGIPIGSSTLGGSNWPWLPLGSPDLRSITALDAPGVVDGRPELDGVVAVTTRHARPSPTDPRARARVMIVNERGDPGPLRFTPLGAPNVDGPLYEVDGAARHDWRGGRMEVTAALRERWSVTRPELRDRNPAFFRGSSSRVRMDGGSAAVTQDVRSARVHARGWASRGDRYLRGPALATELSTDVEHWGVGASVRAPTPARNVLTGYAVATAWDTRSPNARDPVADSRTLDWSERDLDTGVAYTMPRRVRATVGVDLARRTDRIDGVGTPRTSGSAYFSATHIRGAWEFTGSAEGGGDERGSSLLLRVVRRSTTGWSLAGETSLRDGGRGGPQELWNVGRSEPRLFASLGIATTGTDRSHAGRRGTVRLEATLGRPTWEVRAEAFVHDFTGERRPRTTFAWAGTTVAGTWGPVEEGSGRVWGMGGRARARITDALALGVRGRLATVPGDAPFERWWSAAPRARASAEAELRVRPGWYVRGRAVGRTGTTWTAFEMLTPMGAVPGGGRIPGGIVTEIRLEGAVLRGRLKGVAGVTNLFDVDNRLHPLGADEARGLLLGISAGL